MAGFRLSGPLATPAELQIPVYSKVQGVVVKSWGPPELIYITFRTFGGTEITNDNLISVENTATVETWYRPDIRSDCRLLVAGRTYEIFGEPENIQMRNQYLRFRVKEIKGGA